MMEDNANWSISKDNIYIWKISPLKKLLPDEYTTLLQKMDNTKMENLTLQVKFTFSPELNQNNLEFFYR